MNKLLFFTLLGVLAILVVLSRDNTLAQVQAGELTLICHMRDGVREIEPAKVVDLMDGVWIFERGHASNCEIIKGEL